MDIIFNGSTSRVTATLTNTLGQGQTGATLTLTIEELDGTVIFGPEIMADDGDGAYSYLIPYNALDLGVTYRTVVEADNGTARRRSARKFRVIDDRD